MDQCVDVLLVGPWDRVLSARGEDGIRYYVDRLKQHFFIGKVIYSSSDPLGTIPHDIFDNVASTYSGELLTNSYINSNTSYASSRSRLSPYIENVKAGLELCSAKFIIRARSDLELQGIETIHNLLTNSPENIYIDYHPEHSLLIPFYYSDMFLAAKSENVRSLYSGCFERNCIGKKKLSFNPFRYLNAGFWDESYQYPELLFWSKGLCNLNYIENSKYTSSNLIGFIRSLGLINKKLFLVNRNKIFNVHSRFNKEHYWGESILFPWSITVTLRLSIKHLFQYIHKTVKNLYLKLR